MPDWSVFHLVVLAAAGLLGGFVNTLAGGGSLVTLPALLLLGLPADIANGTNRVAVLAQSIIAARGLAPSGNLTREAALWIIVPALAGSLAGAWIAARISPEVLKPILVGTLAVVALTLLWRPDALVPASHQQPIHPLDRRLAFAGLFLIGAYGGFLQAGVGIFLLLFLGGVLQYDLISGNALKSLLIAPLTAVALLVFIIEGQVQWAPGLMLAVTTVIGAHFGVRFAIERGHDAIRRVLFVAVIASCIAAAVK